MSCLESKEVQPAFKTSRLEDGFVGELDTSVDGFADLDQVLGKAFTLAYFIHGDEESARQIVVSAMTKLQVATAAQNKRLYYTPHGRSSARGFRNKVSFSELHLLQRLIYIESEPYEIQKEQQRETVRQEDMLIHFIKHLVRIGIKRNSFYVTLGLSRLLYNYSTAETMEIYNLVVQDPDRVKDDYYYRSRKAVLLQELKKRFGDLIGTHRGPRGEERLDTEIDSKRYAALVSKCLSVFLPWGTACSVPANFDPMGEAIPTLKDHRGRSEDVTEVNRIHAVLHPGCLERLTSALGFNSPVERLAVPHFFLGHNEGEPPRSEFYRDSHFDEKDLQSIKNALAEQASRRRKAKPTVLRIIVDGTEHVRIDLKHARRAGFRLKRMPELIEVRGRDVSGDEILLASHLIAFDEMKPRLQPSRMSVVTEANQRIRINVSLLRDDRGEVAGGQIEVKYEELSLFSAHLLDRLKEGLGYQSLSGVPSLRFVLLMILIAAGIAGVVWYSWNQISPGTPPQVTVDHGESAKPAATQAVPVVSPTPDVEKPKAPLTAGQSGVPSPASSPQPEDERTARHPSPIGSPGTEQSTDENTRSPARGPDAVSLAEVRKVHVEVTGTEPFAGEMSRLLRRHLQASNRLTLVDSRNEADAVLKITINRVATNQILTVAQLVNARGDVLWMVERRAPFVIDREVAQAAAQISKTLVAELQRVKKQ